MRMRSAIGAAALWLALLGGAAAGASGLVPLPGGLVDPLARQADPTPIVPPPVPRPKPPGVVERPEIRSYQPYSTLQYGFRPDAPPQRGVVDRRPRVVMPKRLAPLVPYGSPPPYSEEWYVYCADRYRSFEPATGLYTTFSGDRRLCR